jgi:arylsulfatase A-like enzyme
VANAAWEFGRFLDTLEASGALENTYFILTSDHGEMFERGVVGHMTPLMYSAGLRVPLLISAPGQRMRSDIHASTNSVDILPTLMRIAGRDVPAWCEGLPLPAFGGVEDASRATFSVDAKRVSSFSSLSIASTAMRKQNHKMIYYKGYQNVDSFELYDLDKDPEELTDLYGTETSLASDLRSELLTAFNRFGGPLHS